jgi:hypothetical protein
LNNKEQEGNQCSHGLPLDDHHGATREEENNHECDERLPNKIRKAILND